MHNVYSQSRQRNWSVLLIVFCIIYTSNEFMMHIFWVEYRHIISLSTKHKYYYYYL